jgi:hypothetical protein
MLRQLHTFLSLLGQGTGQAQSLSCLGKGCGKEGKMKYGVGSISENCANYEGEDRGYGRNSGYTSKESLFHNSMGQSTFT